MPARREPERRPGQAGGRAEREPLAAVPGAASTELRGHAEPGTTAAAGRGSALSHRSRPPHQRATLCALVALLGSLDGTASFKNTLCLSQAVCTGPAHICATPPLGSWLAQDGPKGYVPTIMKVCRCQNITKAGPKCDQACPHGHQNPCNGHGECLYDSATCECDEGWQGKECTAECPKRFGKVCANKGTCVADGDNGAKCECFDGFRGETCEIECVGGAARPCAKRGICEPDGTCTCLGGWRGADCSTECPGSNIFPCNIHGKCTREAKCECDPLYRGAACEFRCPDVLGVPCGGRGTCNSVGECDCNIGYRGKDCMQECPGGAANPCSGHGKCLNDTACECSPSWAGEKCDDLCPGGLDNACSGHGKCVTNTENRSIAMCICEQGNGQTSLLRWDGFDCSKKIYNIARPKNNQSMTNVTAKLYEEPGILGAIFPPVTVLLAIMAVIVSRLYTAYANAQAKRISDLNASMAQVSGLEPIQE
eukprot:Tamp_12677.p1 GENE.Tamp_12677~~Tamp_12677.p1  ORF type:complete len:496 (+),score=54.96 Tamp_12677:45-1490(+)